MVLARVTLYSLILLCFIRKTYHIRNHCFVVCLFSIPLCLECQCHEGGNLAKLVYC